VIAALAPFARANHFPLVIPAKAGAEDDRRSISLLLPYPCLCANILLIFARRDAESAEKNIGKSAIP
jgi:hypothetical protein